MIFFSAFWLFWYADIKIKKQKKKKHFDVFLGKITL
jgi:hypothetical protein